MLTLYNNHMEVFNRHAYRILLGFALFTLGIGTVVYHYVEKLSWFNSYYFSVITLTTVGYGDIVPHTTTGKLFTTFYVLAGVGIITTFISYTMRRRTQKFEQRHKKTAKDLEK